MAKVNVPNTSRLQDERLFRRLSLRQVGRLTEIDFTVLSRIETGERVPSEVQRERIAKELDVTPQYLFPEFYGIEGVA